jgi:hypothetical protein
MHGTHGQALALLEKLDEKQKSCHDTLAAIDTTLQGVLVAQSTTTAPSPNVGSSDIHQHLVSLKGRIAAATSAVSNPILRHALQQELESILPKIAACLAQVSDHELRRSEVTSFDIGATPQPHSTKTHTKLIGSFAIASVFGTLQLTTTLATTFVLQKCGNIAFQESKSTHTKAVLYPSQWLQKYGLNHGLFIRLSLSSWGLDCSLKSYRAVPDNAPIFGYCIDGNMKAVQELFDSGLASPWDNDSRGFTPLFVSPRTTYPQPVHRVLTSGAVETIQLTISDGC